jgi:AcrR family transcriptional regulator
MIIPVLGECEWAALDPAAKRERLLSAAAEVFARDGLDAPMPAVAAAAGAGVASVYRQFPSKHELLAALVTRRLEQIAEAAQDAGQRDGDRWSALVEMLWITVERQAADDFLGEARIAVAEHPDVIAAADQATVAIELLLAGARAEGRLRADATTLDLRLLFAATRAAKQVEPQAWPRMLELLIDAFDSGGSAEPIRLGDSLRESPGVSAKPIPQTRGRGARQ